MPAIQHVFRRGAMYHWRRRLPSINGVTTYRLECSLRTSIPTVAKARAVRLGLLSTILFQGFRAGVLTEEEVRKLFKFFALEHSRFLDGLADFERLNGSVEFDQSIRADLTQAWFYKLFAMQGEKPVVRPQDRAQMAASGLDEMDIQHLEAELSDKNCRLSNLMLSKEIEDACNATGIEFTRTNEKQARFAYVRARAAALKNVERRWYGDHSEDDALLQSALESNAKYGVGVEHSNSPKSLDAVSFDAKNPLVSLGFEEVAEKAASEKVASNEWQENSANQARSAARLFVRITKIQRFIDLRPEHLAQFKDALLRIPKKYNKSKSDLELSFEELLIKAKHLPRSQVGLSPQTVNRHNSNINEILNFALKWGVKFDWYNYKAAQGMSLYRVKDRKPQSEKRPPFSESDLAQIWAAPPWNGCRPARRREVGPAILHDSFYWVPLIGQYSGMRLEEICGLLLADIVSIDGILCFSISENDNRPLKTPRSKRVVPVHSELIRLGLKEYIAELLVLEKKDLFPDLVEAKNTHKLGGVFARLGWDKLRYELIPDAREANKTFHSFRHWVNNQMIRQNVSGALRRSILGQEGKDVNERTYGGPVPPSEMQTILESLPIPTARLSRHKIRIRQYKPPKKKTLRAKE